MFSIKMRAAGSDGRHISGAERITAAADIPEMAQSLARRALEHSKGVPEKISMKIERLAEADCLLLPALKPAALGCSTPEEGMALALDLLRRLGITDPEGVLALLAQCQGMRGAILADADSLERLEPDRLRGVRATLMDACEAEAAEHKCHYREAVVLATKVCNAPNIIGEICVSDDPDYVTGYVAGKDIGYVRIETMKPLGSPAGGRVFLYRGPKDGLGACLDFLERQPVLVRDLAPAPEFGVAWDRAGKWDFLKARLAEIEKRNLLREIPAVGPGKLVFASNDYLGLAQDWRVKRAAADAVLAFGAGATGSRLTSGSLALHRELEEELADFCGSEKALLFNSGYAANVGVIQAVCGKDCVVLSDALNHASIIDGCRLSGARTIVYAHNDMADLERKAQAFRGQRGLIVSDAVFSMDGDLANLPEIRRIANQCGFLSMLDEAHGLGVVGKSGRGLAEDHGPDADIVTGSLSKALGSQGGYARGSAALVKYLQNLARSFIFSTSLEPAAAAAALAALRILASEPGLALELRQKSRFFRGRLLDRGVEVGGDGAIVPVIVGDEALALKLALALEAEGILASAIRFPSVARGLARLRLTVRVTHSLDDLDFAASRIAALLKRFHAGQARA